VTRFSIRYPGRARSSHIVIAPGALDGVGKVARSIGARRAAVVSEPRVAALYAARALRSLERSGLQAGLVCVPTGERAKTPKQLASLCEQFADLGIERNDVVVALGGGAVGDLAGFAAAVWLRGIAWIGVPTSLLAQVDSSVGGKTAVDLDAGKNLVGAFHQPEIVLVDPRVLATLPERHRRAGLAEVVKMGLAVDASLFRFVESNADALARGDLDRLGEAVRRSIAAKARIVRADEREREGGSRTSLNLGHTLGHAIEACLGYRGLLHGEAVAIGLRVALRLSVQEAGLPESIRLRAESLLDRLGLPAGVPDVPLADLIAAMRSDKKGRNGRIRWVLTPRLGHASVPRLISSRRIEAVLLDAGARASRSRAARRPNHRLDAPHPRSSRSQPRRAGLA
jgi:3-dehydroquinate synthase